MVCYPKCRTYSYNEAVKEKVLKLTTPKTEEAKQDEIVRYTGTQVFLFAR